MSYDIATHQSKQICIIPYVVSSGKKSIVLEQINNNWQIIQNENKIDYFLDVMLNKLDNLINVETILLKIINNVPEKEDETDYINKQLHAHVNVIILDEFIKLFGENTKLTEILNIWKNEYKIEDLPSKKNVEEHNIEKIMRKYASNFNIYLSEHLRMIMFMINNVLRYNFLIRSLDRSIEERSAIDRSIEERSATDRGTKDTHEKIKNIKNSMCNFVNKNVCNIMNSLTYDDYKYIIKKIHLSSDVEAHVVKNILDIYFLDYKPESIHRKEYNKITIYFIKYSEDNIKKWIKRYRKYIFSKKIFDEDEITTNVGLFYLDDILDETINIAQKKIISEMQQNIV